MQPLIHTDLCLPQSSIVGKTLVLKKHESSLAPVMFETINRDRHNLRQFLPWVDGTKTQQDSVDYIQLTEKEWAAGSLFDYGIFLRATSTYIGNIGVHTIAWKHRRAEIGYWLVSEFQGKGHMSEALSILEKELFHLGFNRLEIRCSSKNIRSANVPKRNHYQHEGILRQDCLEFHGNDQVFRDTLIFAKLKNDRM